MLVRLEAVLTRWLFDQGPIEPLWIVSTEREGEGAPRKCSFVRRVRVMSRYDAALVRIEPPFGAEDRLPADAVLDLAILTPRHVGGTLFRVREWPIHLHLAYVTEGGLGEQRRIRKSQTGVVDWVAGFATCEEADAYRL